MPQVSTFYGITIWMYFDESPHSGRPHFHAGYGNDEVVVAIDDMAVLAGSIPHRALRLTREWANRHRAELRNNWTRARRGEALIAIEPLP